MKNRIFLAVAILTGIIAFQNCAETESILVGGGNTYVGKISRIESVSHGDEEFKIQVDLNTNQYSILSNGNIVREGEVPSEAREQLDDILVDPEICQLVPPPDAICTMQYKPPTKLVGHGNQEEIIDWNKCHSHKILCNGRSSELRDVLIGLQGNDL